MNAEKVNHNHYKNMNAKITRPMKLMFAGLLLASLALTPTVLKAQGFVHHVTGSGLTVVPAGPFSPAFQFRQSISAWQKADGSIGGSIVVEIQGLTPIPVTMVGEITCLTVEGNTAFYSLVTRQ